MQAKVIVGYECVKPKDGGKPGQVCGTRVFGGAIDESALQALSCPVCLSSEWRELHAGDPDVGQRPDLGN